MNPFSDSLGQALALVATMDAALARIVGLSLAVSATSSAIATVLGIAAGAWLAGARFRGHGSVVIGLNTLLALPSVVVGLVVYLLLSRAGPLGSLGILFTPTAMVIAQAILVTPIVAALARAQLATALAENGEQLRSLGAGRSAALLVLAWDQRAALATLGLVAFGRAVSEVGAVMIVGGNIDGVTRVMTTAIALETSKGDLPLALALGIVLLGIVLLLNAGIAALRQRGERVATQAFARVA